MERLGEAGPPGCMPLAGLPRQHALQWPALARQSEVLADLQRKAAHNYFRVLQAYERLNPGEAESRARGNQNVGDLLTRELERERSRIARELHAGAGQPLAGIKLNLDLLRTTFADLSPSVQDSITRLQVLADQALEQVRAVSHRLYPPDWQRLGVAEAIESLWNSSGVAQKFHARLDIRPINREPSHTVKVTLYRCCQECFSNLLRHSGATRVVLSLRQSGDRVALSIEDNGTGFDVADVLSTDSRSRGIGLLAMREQVSSLNGEMNIQSGLRGTKLEISLPLVED